MKEIVRTNDMVLVSAIGALLDGADIPHLVFDANMSVLEGSLGVLPRRILVADELERSARALLDKAGLGHELRPEPASKRTAETTDDGILDGRLTLRQPKRGHRFGHDAVLLAAATAAQSGDHAVELGAGVGAAGLALAWRVPGLKLTLAEIDPDLCALAEHNLRVNGFKDRIEALALDVTASGAFDAAGIEPGSVQHVLMNPPFNDAQRFKQSPNAQRQRAHVAPRETLGSWLNIAARLLAGGGVVTLIWRAEDQADVLSALANAGFGEARVLPVYPRPGADAIRVLVRGRKGSRAPSLVLKGITLNDENGRPSAQAETILRSGTPLNFVEN